MRVKSPVMNRRHALTALAALAAVCPLAAAAAGEQHWSYQGATGPAGWGSLEADFKSCSLGLEQSPIDLRGPVRASVGALRVGYRPAPLRVWNNGHTIQCNYAPGSSMTIHGRTYGLVQFHFHTPSEHTLGGEHAPLELHLVHQDENKNLAVLGVFLKEGQENAALEPIWAHAPASEGPEREIPGVQIDAADLVPAADAYYTYLGSLTTPPCSEGVRWIVLARAITLSSAQIAKFKSIFPMNARPTQPLNQRFVLMEAP
jgi:carbonic anhydrase